MAHTRRRTLGTLVAVTAVAGVGLLLWGSDSEAPRDTPRGASPRASAPRIAATDAPRSPALSAPAATLPTPPATRKRAAPPRSAPAEPFPDEGPREAPASPTVVRGRVLTQQAEPVPGALVELYDRAQSVPGVSTLADGAGRFELRIAVSDPEATLFLEAQPGPDDDSTETQTRNVAPGQVNLIDLILAPSCTLDVKVEPPQRFLEVRLEGPLDSDDAILFITGLEGDAIDGTENSPTALGLEAGRYRVTALGHDARDVRSWASVEVQLSAGHHTVGLKLAELIEVAVELRADGHPAPGLILAEALGGRTVDRSVHDWVSSGQDGDGPDDGLLEDRFVEATGLDGRATGPDGVLLLRLPPGRWRLTGLAQNVPLGRAERTLNVGGESPIRCVLDHPGSSQSATVVLSTPLSGGGEVAVGGRPGMQLSGHGDREFAIHGLLPSERVAVFVEGYTSENDDADYCSGVVEVSAGTRAELTLVAPADLRVRALAESTAVARADWVVAVEPLDTKPVSLDGRAFLVAESLHLWGPERQRVTDLSGGYWPDTLTRWRGRMSDARTTVQTFYPGRYRVTLEGWTRPLSRVVELKPGAEETLSFELTR